MSAEAVGWALKQSLDPPAKIILVTLADCMNTETGLCCPSQGFLAGVARCSKRTVIRRLTALEEEGYLQRSRRVDQAGHRSTDSYVLGLPVNLSRRESLGDRIADPYVTESLSLGDTHAYAGKEPEVEPEEGTRRKRASTPTKPSPDEPPESFPDELRPHANIVLSLLREAAVERGAKAVTVRAVGRVVMDHPRKPLVAAAQSMRAWLLDGNGASAPCKDVVMRYRKWLGGEQDLAAPERLDAAGHPTASVSTRRGDVESPRDRQLRERQAQADRDGPAMKAVLAEMGIGDANRAPRVGPGAETKEITDD